MSPYTNNSRQNRGRGGSSRHDSGRSDFMTVLLFYVLPFIVVNSIIFILVTAAPKGDLTIGEADNFTTTTMELKIKSLFPIKAMTVTLDGNEVVDAFERGETVSFDIEGTQVTLEKIPSSRMASFPSVWRIPSPE